MLDSTRHKLIILGFICCIYIIVLSLFVHYENIDLSKLKSIVNNLDNSPIFDISLSNNGKCENSEKIILGHHKTKEENCNCHGKFHPGYCTYEELRNGCITIEPKKINNIHIWDGNEFCIKTNNKSYIELLNHTVNKNEECKKGFKNCGFIDTLNHKFCINEKKNCPINNIEISKSNVPPNDGFKYKTIPLKNNKYLYFTNENINNNIISSLTFSKEKSGLNHTFDKKTYNLIDNELKKNLLEDNILYVNEKNFTNHNISLFSGTYYGFNLQYIKNGHNFKYIIYQLDNYRLTSIFWETIICIIMFIMLINELFRIGKIEESTDLLKIALFDILKVIISSCFCYFTLIEFLKTSNFGLPDNESDDAVNQLFINYNKELTIVCLIALSKFLVSVFLIIIILINIFEGDCKELFENTFKSEYNLLPIYQEFDV